MNQARVHTFSMKALIVLLLTLNICAYAQANALTKLDSLFLSYRIKTLPEKLYLHTDRDRYSIQDSILFKGYLCDATLHTQATLSKYIYVELITSTSEAVARVKIKSDSLGRFSNIIKIPTTIPLGKYSITAYTKLMQNQGASCFFYKNIEIYDSNLPTIISSVNYEEYNDEKFRTDFYFTSATNIPLKNIDIDVRYEENGKWKDKIIKTDTLGRAHFNHRIEKDKELKVTLRKGELGYEQNHILSIKEDDFDFQFMPEGGDLISGTTQKLAFKSIGTDGYHVESEGNIYESDGKLVYPFKTTYKGMGVVNVLLDHNKSYYAEVRSGTRTCKVSLPPIKEHGASIIAVLQKKALILGVINSKGFDLSDYALAIHTRGKIITQTRQLAGNIFTVPTELLRPGISEAILYNVKTHELLSRRSIFRYDEQAPVAIQTSLPQNNTRDKVNISLTLQDADKQPIAGDFSVAITDAKFVTIDNTNNIVTDLLLTSDIKGHIEDPAAYFTDNTNLTMYKRDLLMMTQGWGRFNTATILKDSVPLRAFEPESEIYIRGKVRGLFTKKPKNTTLLIMDSRTMVPSLTELNSHNSFTLRDLDIPYGTSYIATVLNKSGRSGLLEIDILDHDKFPQIKSPIITKRAPRYTNTLHTQFLPQGEQEENFYYINGMMNYLLGEVTVESSFLHTEEDIFAQNTALTASTLKHYSTIYQALSYFPELTVRGFEVFLSEGSNYFGASTSQHDITSNYEDTSSDEETFDDTSLLGDDGMFELQPGLSIDGESCPIEMLSTININDVVSLNYITADEAMGNSTQNSENGVITIRLKPLRDREGDMPSPALALINPLGYSPEVTHYNPRYEIDSVRNDNSTPDQRITLGWFPLVRPNKDGQIQLDFFTSDRKASNYTIELEGITQDGTPINFVEILENR